MVDQPLPVLETGFLDCTPHDSPPQNPDLFINALLKGHGAGAAGIELGDHALLQHLRCL